MLERIWCLRIRKAVVSDIVYRHGVNCTVFEDTSDDSELVNSITILGETKRKTEVIKMNVPNGGVIVLGTYTINGHC